MNSTPENATDADPNAITIEEANALIASKLPILDEFESLPVNLARGRYLSEDLISPMPSPPFRASAMDGYAYRFADNGNQRQVIADSFAGHPGPNQLSQGQCVRVTTGAKVPDEADTVVQLENVSINEDQLTIQIAPTQPGHHVRDIGSDCRSGACIATAGTRITAGIMGLCAALGIQQLNVYRRIRITVVSTGDELKRSGDTLSEGQIYDANTTLLAALLTDPNFDVRLGEHMLDNPNSVNEALTSASVNADFIMTTGGVSVGTHDHLREVMESRGGVELWKVAMKPGRPLSFGLLDGKTPWFGLPGNPVSAALTTLLFVFPALRHSQQLPSAPLRTLSATSLNNLRKLPGRVEFQRGVLATDADGNLTVSTTGLQDSHVLSSLAQANCFIRLPVRSTGAITGESVTVVPYEFFGQALI